MTQLNDAIFTDAPESTELDFNDFEQEAKTEQKKWVDPRDEMIDSIVSQSLGDDDFDPDAPDTDEAIPEMDATEPEQKAEPEKAAEQPQKFKVKIDGEEQEVTLDQLTAGFQKNATASKRLEEAARKAKEIAEWEARLVAQANALEERHKEAPTPEIKSAIREFMDAALDGRDEEAADIFANLMKAKDRPAPVQPQIDPERIAASVEERLESKAAMKDLMREFPVLSDTDSRERKYADYLWVTKFEPMFAAGELSYRDALFSAAKETSDIFEAKDQPSGTQEREAIQEKKKTQTTVPIAGVRSKPDPNYEPQKVSDIIAEMRRERGLP